MLPTAISFALHRIYCRNLFVASQEYHGTHASAECGSGMPLGYR